MTRPIAAARIAAGMTQEQAGALIGRNQGHYGKIERGDLALKADDALTLCRAWNVTLSQLLTGQ